MSRAGEVTIDWGGEAERTFRLGIGQIRALQEKTGAGPLGIAARCQIAAAALAYQRQGDWVALSRLDLTQIAEMPQVREALLQGLLGMNMALPVADKLVRDWVDERPLAENLVACVAVCTASVYGVEQEKSAGEPEAVEEGAGSQNSPTASTASEKTGSMRSARRAASHPAM